MAKHRIATAASATALALSGVMVPTSVFATVAAPEGETETPAYSPVDGQITENWTLTEDVTGCYTVKADTPVTIDLGSFKITCNESKKHAIDVDEGTTVTIEATAEGGALATNGSAAAVYARPRATVTIAGGSYQSEKWYTVKNQGVMTIADGVFSQGEGTKPQDEGGSNASMIVNGDNNKDDGVARMIITGGTFNQTYSLTSSVKNGAYSDLKVTGGTFNTKRGFTIQASGKVNVEGGTFNGGEKNSLFAIAGVTDEKETADYAPGTVEISGGSFNSSKYLAKLAANGYEGGMVISGGSFNTSDGVGETGSEDISISGGTFGVAPKVEELAEGKLAYKVAGEGEETAYKIADTTVFGAPEEKIELKAGGYAHLAENTPIDYIGGWNIAMEGDAKGDIWTDDTYGQIGLGSHVTGTSDKTARITLSPKAGGVVAKDAISFSTDVTAKPSLKYAANEEGVSVSFENAVDGNVELKVERVEELPEAAVAAEPTLRALFDISVMDGDEVVSVDGNKMRIYLQFESEEEYKNFQVVYIKDGKIAQYIDVAEGWSGCYDGICWVEFETDHLSGYGVLAGDEEYESAEDKNKALGVPDTGAMTSIAAAVKTDIAALVATVAVMTLATAGMEIALWKKRQSRK